VLFSTITPGYATAYTHPLMPSPYPYTERPSPSYSVTGGYQSSLPVDLKKDLFLGNMGDDFLTQKREIINSKLTLLFTELTNRYRLTKENLSAISYDQCTCRNLISAMDEDRWDRNRLQLEQKIIDLEGEKERRK